MNNLKGSRATRSRHRPSFARIERLLPLAGSAEAKLLGHVLRCEACTDAALSILKIGGGPSKGRRKPDYGSTLGRVEARTVEVFAWISEQGRRAADFVEELTQLPDEPARKQRVQELARIEPWLVAVALLRVANRLLRTEPERAAGFADLAVTAAEEITPDVQPLALKAGVLVQAHALRGEILRRLGRSWEARRAFARAQELISATTDNETRSLFCHLLSRFRQMEGRAEEAVALLDRAASLAGGEELEDFDA